MNKKNVLFQDEIDDLNRDFWNELCGSNLAKKIGITEINAETIKKFDREYFKLYPYLYKDILSHDLSGKSVLEIGLGYGSLGQLLAGKHCNYYGVDIAEGPVNMMKFRLSINNLGDPENIHMASALSLPFPDKFFNSVYSIGCLHHTGNISKAISEVFRVTKPGGVVYIMVYNKHSFRQLIQYPIMSLINRKNGQFSSEDLINGMYDKNSNGTIAPLIEYFSCKEVKEIFSKFSEIQIKKQNFDDYYLINGRLKIKREFLLNNIARFMGLDLYIFAKK